ncbi:DUF3817 domain-containing protein [Ruania zhangjianzhongii]|uniref:DUF3817 domain-containing protein n=1 Tax=Ruania zhangjianzhongii TaxID=2603206 RepID=UPI0011CA5535|nr:DUF3817 domain-containing protein [Ruania zhangjianzhongii]
MSTIAARPARLYGVLALAEMITWALLLSGMFVKYVLDGWDGFVRIGGSIHGFVFLSYVVVTVLVAVDQRWKFSSLALGLGSAIIPFLTLPFERSAARRGMLGATWRLRSEEPTTPVERVAALALKHPVLAAVTAVIVVAVVFSVLLSLGPPTEWFS